MSDFVIDPQTLAKNPSVEVERVRQVRDQLESLRALGLTLGSSFRLSAPLGDHPLNLNRMLSAKARPSGGKRR